MIHHIIPNIPKATLDDEEAEEEEIERKLLVTF
jgi:hypothetical protein